MDAVASVRGEGLAPFSNDLRISDYRNSIAKLDLTAGVNLGLTGQIRLGWRNEHQTVEIETGLPILANDPVQIRGWQASWETDQKNQLHIATTGWYGKGSIFESANGDYNLLNLKLEGSYQLADWVLRVRGNYAGSTSGKLSVQQMGRLGGFLNLSDFATDQLMGNRVSYGHIRVERILARMPTGMAGDLRAGFAFELGKVADSLSPFLNNAAPVYSTRRSSASEVRRRLGLLTSDWGSQAAGR